MRGPRPESLPGRTVEGTRAAYQELVRAGLMYPVSWNRRDEIQRPPGRFSASAMVSNMRRAWSLIGKAVSTAR